MRDRFGLRIVSVLAVALVAIGITVIGIIIATHHTEISSTDCGMINVEPGPGGTTTSVQAAEACFWHAYQSRQPATLIYAIAGNGEANFYRFFLHPCHGGTCTLSDSHDVLHVAPQPNQHVGTFMCSGLTRKPDGSLIAQHCGQDGDITIPASASVAAG
jgi:hypothetical protein